jgi:hypothetical protein
MKLLGIVINQIADVFFRIERWAENTDIFRDIGIWFCRLGRKIYSNGYCSNCKDWLEICFYGGDEEMLKPHCCNCEHPLTDKQIKDWAKRRLYWLAKRKAKNES